MLIDGLLKNIYFISNMGLKGTKKIKILHNWKLFRIYILHPICCVFFFELIVLSASVVCWQISSFSCISEVNLTESSQNIHDFLNLNVFIFLHPLLMQFMSLQRNTPILYWKRGPNSVILHILKLCNFFYFSWCLFFFEFIVSWTSARFFCQLSFSS